MGTIFQKQKLVLKKDEEETPIPLEKKKKVKDCSKEVCAFED